MAWVRIDDQAPRHDKMLKAGPAACWLWVCGIAHSQSQLTDGFISFESLPMIGVAGNVRAMAEKLVTVGLFDAAEEYDIAAFIAPTEDGARVLRLMAGEVRFGLLTGGTRH